MATQSSKLYLPQHKLTIVLLLGIRRKLGLLTLVIMTSLWKLLSLPRVLSLRSKRFRAVSGERTRNESQRPKNRASKRAGENPVPWTFFARKPHGKACYAGYLILLLCSFSVLWEIIWEILKIENVLSLNKSKTTVIDKTNVKRLILE